MNPIPLDTPAALRALRDHLARPVSGPFAVPDWLTSEARPLRAWQQRGPQPADRKEQRADVTLYLFRFDEPPAVGHFTLAGYVLVAFNGGSWVVNWWDGADPEAVAGGAISMTGTKCL